MLGMKFYFSIGETIVQIKSFLICVYLIFFPTMLNRSYVNCTKIALHFHSWICYLRLVTDMIIHNLVLLVFFCGENKRFSQTSPWNRSVCTQSFVFRLRKVIDCISLRDLVRHLNSPTDFYSHNEYNLNGEEIQTCFFLENAYSANCENNEVSIF